MSDFFHIEDEMIRIAREQQESYEKGYTVYCPTCDWFFDKEDVISKKGQEPKCPDCGSQELGHISDPPYDHTGYDTLEEKYL